MLFTIDEANMKVQEVYTESPAAADDCDHFAPRPIKIPCSNHSPWLAFLH